MRLWTIQRAQVWDDLQADGIWRAKTSLASTMWPQAYRWMRHQLCDRVGPPVVDDQSPIWAWHCYMGEKHARPDLRHTTLLPSGTPGVRITLDVDDSRVLLSDFELWHFALNYWFLAESEAEDNAFEDLRESLGVKSGKRHLRNSDLHYRVLKSWERIFDPHFETDPPDWYYSPGAPKRIQAVLWEIRQSDVKKVEQFIAR